MAQSNIFIIIMFFIVIFIIIYITNKYCFEKFKEKKTYEVVAEDVQSNILPSSVKKTDIDENKEVNSIRIDISTDNLKQIINAIITKNKPHLDQLRYTTIFNIMILNQILL